MWRALCLPFNEEVAVKLLDLENVNCSLVIPSAQHGADLIRSQRMIIGRYALADVRPKCAGCLTALWSAG